MFSQFPRPKSLWVLRVPQIIAKLLAKGTQRLSQVIAHCEPNLMVVFVEFVFRNESIGVTTGLAFTGVVGHKDRHEYTGKQGDPQKL